MLLDVTDDLEPTLTHTDFTLPSPPALIINNYRLWNDKTHTAPRWYRLGWRVNHREAD